MRLGHVDILGSWVLGTQRSIFQLYGRIPMQCDHRCSLGRSERNNPHLDVKATNILPVSRQPFLLFRLYIF
jgi:hypothetical protein